MMGMEKMLAGMLGMTPEQMKEQLAAITTLASSAAETLQRMDDRLARIEEGMKSNVD